MTNLLKGHEDFIVSHTRKEIMQKKKDRYKNWLKGEQVFITSREVSN